MTCHVRHVHVRSLFDSYARPLLPRVLHIENRLLGANLFLDKRVYANSPYGS